MRQYMDKLLERDVKLSELENRPGKNTKLLLKEEHNWE